MSFYKLDVSRRRTFIESDSSNSWETVYCPLDPGHQRAGRRTAELRLEVMNWNIVDFSRTMLGDIVITQHALDVLSGFGLTGFDAKPTLLVTCPESIDREKLPVLWELVVIGDGGRAHESSGIERLKECPGCGLVEYSAFSNGIIVDDSNYDGADFFTVVEYPKYILVSERAKLIAERQLLTNARFLNSAQLEWPKGVKRR